MFGHKSKAKTAVEEAVIVPGPEVEVVTFHRFRDPLSHMLMAETAIASYVAGGAAYRLKLAVTWEALALLRNELTRNGKSVPDDDLIALTLSQFLQEEASERHRLTGTYPEEQLILAFHGGPKSTAPRELLERCGLLD